MTKESFLNDLSQALEALGDEERESILDYYEEIIDDRMEAGMTEEAAVNAMEPVEDIAARVLDEQQPASGEGRDSAAQTGDKEIRRALDGVAELRVFSVSQRVIVRRGEQQDLILRYHIGNGDVYRLHEEKGVITLEHKRRPITSFSHEGGDAFAAVKNLVDTVGSWLSNLDWGAMTGSSLTSRTIEVVLPPMFHGSLHVVTSNNAITAEEVTLEGNLLLETSNGSVTVAQSHAQAAEVITSNGRIEASDFYLSQDGRLATSNGAIAASRVCTDGSLNLSTSNGRVTLDSVQAYNLTVKNSNGTVSGTVQGNEDEFTVTSATSNGRNTLGNHGSGDRQLKVYTSNGSIEVSFLS